MWRSIWPNCVTGNQWKSNLNKSTIWMCISLTNPLVTLLFIRTYTNLTRKYCIVKTTLTLEILALKACMKARKAKNSASQRSGEIKCSLSSKGAEVSLAKVNTKCLGVAEHIIDNRIRSQSARYSFNLQARRWKSLFQFPCKKYKQECARGHWLSMENLWCSRKGKFRNYFQNREVGFYRELRNQEHITICNGNSCKLRVKQKSLWKIVEKVFF